MLARKSRKNIIENKTIENNLLRATGYIGLSVNKADQPSESIENQKKIIAGYSETDLDFQLEKFYIDDKASVFEEVFKLIYAKLYDELMAARDKTAYLHFRNNGCTDYELKQKISELFEDAKSRWDAYQPNLSSAYPNARAVKWLKCIPRTVFTQGALYEIGAA